MIGIFSEPDRRTLRCVKTEMPLYRFVSPLSDASAGCVGGQTSVDVLGGSPHDARNVGWRIYLKFTRASIFLMASNAFTP